MTGWRRVMMELALVVFGLGFAAFVSGAPRHPQRPAARGARALPASKSTAPAARPLTWVCGTLTTGGKSVPVALGFADRITVSFDQGAELELWRQAGPCGGGRR